MRKLVLGILGFAALGFGAAALQPAEAQPYYPGYRHGPVEYRGHGGYRPAYYPGPRGYRDGYGPRRGYGPRGYYRPVFAPPPPRCFVRMERAWNGWRWVQQPVRVCR